MQARVKPTIAVGRRNTRSKLIETVPGELPERFRAQQRDMYPRFVHNRYLYSPANLPASAMEPQATF